MDFTGLADHLVSALYNDGYEVPVENIQSALDSFAPQEEESQEELHTCEKTVRGENGSYICGKNCKNEVDGLWYCGTEKSGHYKSALAAAKKDPVKPKGKATAAKSKAVVPSAKGKSKSSALVSNIIKSEQLNFSEAAPDSGLFIESAHRLLADQSTGEVYGVLDEDNETILPIEGEALAFAEAHNLTIREDALVEKKAPKGKSAPAKGKAPAAKGKAAPVAKGKAPAAKGKAAPVVAKGKAAPVAAKGKAAPVVAKGKAAPSKGKAAPVAAKGKAAPAKGKAIPAKGKAAPVAAKGKAAPAKGKATPAKGKAKSKIPPPTEEDDETLNELKAGIEDAAVEDQVPEVDEIVEDDGTAETEQVDAEVDFGVEEEPEVGEEEEPDVGEEEDAPDVEEEDEGEAIEDGEEGEEGEVEADE